MSERPKIKRPLGERIRNLMSPHVSGAGRMAALRIVTAFVGGCAVWSMADNAVMWAVGFPDHRATSVRVIHDGLLLTVLGLLAYHAALYAISLLETAREEVERNDIETVLRFARAADQLESYSTGHNLRVALMSREIARHMGFDEASCNDILHASMLHDIGEIGVPDSIRMKPQPLTAFERLRMMRHVEIGADLLISDRRLLAMACRIARHHHENWDGTGYPDGLHGEEIPVEARIVALTDSFDAMVTDRPYRPAMPVAEALTTISGLVGTRFDPRVVEALLETMPAIERIRGGSEPDWRQQAEDLVKRSGLAE